MSLVKSKAIQLGFDATPTNNFLIYQPLTPDGTFRIANGNQGATTDIMTVTSGGSVTFAGTTNFSSLNFGAGSASAPSLFPTGDSNTGIWFPAADTFAVSTAGTERIRIDSSGNLSLGATAVGYNIKLDVVGNIRSYHASANTSVDVGRLGDAIYYNSINIWSGYNANVPSHSWGQQSGQANYNFSQSLTFNSWTSGTSYAERLRIDSSTGNIGIGNTSPVYSLDIATPNSGNIAWQRTGVSAKKWGISSDNYGTYIGNVTDATWNILTLLNGGNVGIGVGSPSYTLDVQSTTPGIRIKATANASVGLLFNANASGSDRPGEIRYLNDNSMIFCTNGQAATNERMRIDAAGNFLLGASSGPSSPVRATIIGPGMTQDAAIPAQVVVTSTEAYNASPTAGVSFWNKYNASGAYAGMGGISVAKATTTDGDYSSQLSLFTRPSSGAVAERLRITSAGNVGIANTSPNALLQIGAQYDVTGAVKHNPLIIGGRYSNNSSTTNQYQVMSFIGTTSYTDDIFTHTSGEAMKNYYVGLVTDNPYFNANRFAVIQGGAERLTIQGYGTNVGFVGIGAANPQAKLHIGSGWVGIHSDINTSTAVPTITTSRITGEIHAGAGVSSGSDGGLLRLSAGGESSVAQKACIDLSGYNTTDGGPTLRFYAGSTAERVKIDSSGRVTMPYQPVFNYRRAATVAYNTSGIALEMVYDSAVISNSGFNTSTGRFTAPVTGRYFVAVTCYTNQGWIAGISIRKNGSSQYAYADWYAASGNDHRTICCTIDLAAGEYVSAFAIGTGWKVVMDTNSNFSGYLIG